MIVLQYQDEKQMVNEFTAALKKLDGEEKFFTSLFASRLASVTRKEEESGLKSGEPQKEHAKNIGDMGEKVEGGVQKDTKIELVGN